jgi:hypothetical protein
MGENSPNLVTLRPTKRLKKPQIDCSRFFKIRDQCYDFKNIFDKKLAKTTDKTVVFSA